MDFCKTVEIAYAALPLRPFRDWLIRAHMERCPRCQAGLLSREEAKSLLVGPDQAGGTGALWRRIAGQAGRVAAVPEREPARTALVWRWAAAASMAAVIALTGFWLLREIERPGFDAGAVRAGRPVPDRLRQRGRRARADVRLQAPGDGHRLRLGFEDSPKGGVR